MASSHLLAGHSRTGSDSNFMSTDEFGSGIDNAPAYTDHPKVDILDHDYIALRAVPERPPVADSTESYSKSIPDTRVASSTQTGPRPWKPYYVRRRFLYGFIVLFIILIAILQALLAISDKQNGLATSFSGLHYLWTYGPTAVLTIIAAVWARVEYQAKLIAPWTRMSKPPAGAERTVLLDYISIFQPVSIFKALHNKDTVVAAIAMVSLLLKVIIVVSTALITLSLVEITWSDKPITVESRFVNDLTGLVNIGTLPYFTMIGMKHGNITFPDGLSQQYAYQQVNSILSPTPEVSATVDGFATGLDCETASLNVTSIEESAGGPSPNWNITVAASQCEMDLYNLAPELKVEDSSDKAIPTYFSRFITGGCASSSELDDQRAVIIFGRLNYTLTRGTKLIGGHYNNNYSLNMFESTQLACKPNYNISKVDIVKNGTDLQSITLSSDPQPRTLDAVHPWELMEAHFSSFSEDTFTTGSSYQQEANISGDTRVDVDSVMKLAFETRSTRPQPSSLFEQQFLQDYMDVYWTQYGAIMAHTGLMQPAADISTGTAFVNEDRLLVRPLAAHLMSGFLAACILLIAMAAYTAPSKAILPRNPGTILGVAALVSHSQELVTSLQRFGAESMQGISNRLKGSMYRLESSGTFSTSSYPPGPFQVVTDSNLFKDDDRNHNYRHMAGSQPPEKFFHPTTLSPALRITICVLLLGVIASLEATLRTSDSNDGLGDVSDETYLHFLWTTGPAILLSMLGMYFASVDFQLRAMVPFVNMKHYSSFASSVNLDLLDLFTPHMMYREFRIGHTAALAATISAFIASFLTVFSGSLFLAESISSVDSMQLRTQDTFVARSSFSGNVEDQNQEEEASLASLILVSNLSYPAFTYEDLAFPEFLLDVNISSHSVKQFSNSTSVVVNADLPALQPRLDCKLYTASDIITNLTIGYKDKYGNESPLAINVTGEECRSTYGQNIIFPTGDLTTSRYFGVAGQGDAINFVESCSDYLFAWGRLDMDGTQSSVIPMAMGCNESLESVNVAATFLGTGLVLDPDNPPVSNNASNSTFVNSPNLVNQTSSIYRNIANITSRTDSLDAFFVHLTTSRYAMPVSYLGNASQADAVIEAIRFQHGIIRAQNLNAKFRASVNGTVDATGDSAEVEEEQRKLSVEQGYNATVTDTVGRRRVVQDEASTRVLQALLSATLLFFLLSWGLMRDTDSLPRAPTGLASVVALLADGNLLDHLPPDAEFLSNDELKHIAFQNGAMFCMGWGHAGSQTQGVNGDHGKGETFGIWVVERDDNLIEQWDPR